MKCSVSTCCAVIWDELAGRSKQGKEAGIRKWAREARWQQRVTDAAEGPSDPNGPSEAGIAPELVSAMARQERTDKYIDQILRKRKAPALRAPPPAATPRCGLICM